LNEHVKNVNEDANNRWPFARIGTTATTASNGNYTYIGPSPSTGLHGHRLLWLLEVAA